MDRYLQMAQAPGDHKQVELDCTPVVAALEKLELETYLA
jgi:hypothetical protein